MLRLKGVQNVVEELEVKHAGLLLRVGYIRPLRRHTGEIFRRSSNFQKAVGKLSLVAWEEEECVVREEGKLTQWEINVEGTGVKRKETGETEDLMTGSDLGALRDKVEKKRGTVPYRQIMV